MAVTHFQTATICLSSFVLFFSGQTCRAQDTAAVRVLIAKRALSDAETVVLRNLSADPRSVNWIVLLAEIRLDQKRVQESLQLLQNARDLGDNSSRPRLLAGLDYVASIGTIWRSPS